MRPPWNEHSLHDTVPLGIWKQEEEEEEEEEAEEEEERRRKTKDKID